MQKYIERMIEEKKELDGRINKAVKAVENPPYGSDKQGLSLLSKQIEYMKQYSNILEERINYELGKNN